MPIADQISELQDKSVFQQAYEINPKSQDRNWFLSELSPAELAVLRPHLTTFEMRPGDCLHYFGERIDDVVFPHAGLVALTMPLRETSGASALLIGREGIVGGFAAAASAPATCNAEVHIGGRASRMSAATFRYALEENPTMRRLAARFDRASWPRRSRRRCATPPIKSKAVFAAGCLKSTIAAATEDPADAEHHRADARRSPHDRHAGGRTARTGRRADVPPRLHANHQSRRARAPQLRMLRARQELRRTPVCRPARARRRAFRAAAAK